jgi:hypothetical protein
MSFVADSIHSHGPESPDVRRPPGADGAMVTCWRGRALGARWHFDLRPKVPVEMREWIGPAVATPGFVLELQPPAQPHRCVAVECPRASGWSSLTTPWGFPCCVRFPSVHAAATTPARRLNVSLRSFHSDASVPIGLSGRPAHCRFRGLLGVHSRCGLPTRAFTNS